MIPKNYKPGGGNGIDPFLPPQLEVGDRFQQSQQCRGLSDPLVFEVLSIDRPNNSIRVLVKNFKGNKWEETWDDLNVAEIAFTIREYEFIEDE